MSDALVFPSYREGFPNVVLQAGAMGLPSIVTDINGCNEIVEDQKNGLIIPPKDEKALEKSMLKMVSDHKLYQMLQINARENIISKYSQAEVWQALHSEYINLLKELAGIR